MKLSKSLIIPVILLLLSFSCKKHDTACVGGKGGSALIIVNPQAHDVYIDTCTIYIKYGTNDAPANGVYDDSDSVRIVNGLPTVTFSNLTSGCYYILGVGYHTGFVEPNVKGGQPVTISGGASQTVTVHVGSYTP